MASYGMDYDETEAELEEMKRAARDACLAEIEGHLHDFLRRRPDARYEEWVAELHPESLRLGEGGGIDRRYYVEDSDHRRVWNARVGARSFVPATVQGAGYSPLSNSWAPPPQSLGVTSSTAKVPNAVYSGAVLMPFPQPRPLQAWGNAPAFPAMTQRPPSLGPAPWQSNWPPLRSPLMPMPPAQAPMWAVPPAHWSYTPPGMWRPPSQPPMAAAYTQLPAHGQAWPQQQPAPPWQMNGSMWHPPAPLLPRYGYSPQF